MRRRGFTLIEMAIAIGIAALATTVAIASMNALTDASLRSTAVSLTGAVKMSYDRAIMQKRTERLAIDLDRGLWWIEFTEAPFSLSKERAEGERGERSGGEGDEEEKDQEKDDKRFGWFDDQKTEVERILEAQPPPFVPDADIDGGLPQPLPSGVRFSRVWTGHQEEWFTEGVAYVHFFKAGYSEPAIIELQDEGEDVISLEIQPLTGRVRSKHEKMRLPDIEENDGRKEGDE